MIPFQALLTPLYLMFAKLGLANSQLGLAIVHTVIQLPFSIYLLRNSFDAVPKEIEEELANKERAFRGRKESEIFSTQFKVLYRDGKFTIQVTEQIPVKR